MNGRFWPDSEIRLVSERDEIGHELAGQVRFTTLHTLNPPSHEALRRPPSLQIRSLAHHRFIAFSISSLVTLPVLRQTGLPDGA